MVTRLVKFSDHMLKGKWARIIMSDEQPCFIAVGPRSLVLKRSKTGIVGPRLFEIRRLQHLEKIAASLNQQFPKDLTPAGMTNSLLRPIVNAVLHCRDLDETLTTLKNVELT